MTYLKTASHSSFYIWEKCNNCSEEWGFALSGAFLHAGPVCTIHFLVPLGVSASSLLVPPRTVPQRLRILPFESHDLMQVCGFFGGRSSLSLLGFFNFSPVPHPFSVTAWAMCFWLQVKEAVKHALSVGYRHIDCAAAYSNEAEIGEAFQECVGPNKVKTQELPSWRCAVPTLTAVPFEVSICGFSCWSSPAVCYLSGKAWRRAFSS